MLGCMDRTYIPTGKYTNRPDQLAMTLQAVCDVDMRFLDVFSGAEGIVDDAMVFNLSPVAKKLERICDERFYVVGNDACEIREWLMTPFRSEEHLDRGTQNFNEKVEASQEIVRQAFACLRERFVQLNQVHIRGFDRISKFIVSCCVIHNLCIDENRTNDEAVHLTADDTQLVADNTENAIFLRQLGEAKRLQVCNSLLF